MKTVRITAYEFNELNEDIRDKVVSELGGWLFDNEYICEIFKDILSKYGIEVKDIFYNFSYSQSDYVAIDGVLADPIKFIKKIKETKRFKKIRDLFGYNILFTVGNRRVDIILNNYACYDEDDFLNEFRDCVEDVYLNEIIPSLEEIGYKYCGDCYSYEEVDRFCNINRLLFDEQGRIINGLLNSDRSDSNE